MASSRKYKVAKHFELTITDTAAKHHILESQVAAEAALDGTYVIRTALPKKQMSTPDAVRSTRRPSKLSARSAP